jgi:hypothetical protein
MSWGVPSASRCRSVAVVSRRLAAALCIAVFAGAPADAMQLVTPAEAALPFGDMPALELRGSPLRRPHVDVVAPAVRGGVVSSPLHIIMRFHAFGGAKIDSQSIVVTYKKQPMVNITTRILPYVSATGIDLPDAEVPPGLHEFRILVRDDGGHQGGADFRIQVSP